MQKIKGWRLKYLIHFLAKISIILFFVVLYAAGLYGFFALFDERLAMTVSAVFSGALLQKRWDGW